MLIKNATVVTCDDEGTIIRDGAVAIVDGRIAAVGKTADVEPAYNHLQSIDASGKAVLPGLINAHTHTVLTVIRGTVEDMDVNAVYAYMTPITFVMTPDERGAMAALGCLESIRCGSTTLVDPLRFVEGYAQAMVDSGLRLFLSESAADALTLEIRHGRYEYSREWGEQFLERTLDLVERFHGADNGRVQCQVAAHATENCSPWMLGRLMELADRHALRRTIHLAQSRAEVEQVRKLSGNSSTPTEYLRDNGWLGPEASGRPLVVLHGERHRHPGRERDAHGPLPRVELPARKLRWSEYAVYRGRGRKRRPRHGQHVRGHVAGPGASAS